MTTTLTTTGVRKLKINKLTKTQLDNATTLTDTEVYLVDPEFTGGKLLETTASGEIVESNQTIPTVDQTYDGSSTNAQSGVAVASALSNYQQKATIETLDATDSITLADNTIYNGGEQTALTITLPATVDVSFLCEIDFSSGTSATTMTYPQSGIVWAGDGVASNIFVPETNTRYTIICAYDGVNYRFITKGV